MEYRHLGKSGLKVSALSLGAWVTMGSQVGDDIAAECMHAAREAGVNFFDNAEAYGGGKAENTMGHVLKNSGWKRSSYIVSTKIFWGGDEPNEKGLSHKHVIEGVHAALDRLQLTYVDLCYCHRPDPETPIEETVRAMDILVRQGKVFYWGTGEWSAGEIMRAHGIAKENGLTPPTMEQPQYNMLWRRRVELEYKPVFKELGYGATTWSPLASGILTGKYNSGVPKGSRLGLASMKWLAETALDEEHIKHVRALEPVAKELGCSMAQLGIAWCLKNPNVSSVITGASRKDQVVENMKALDVAKRIDHGVMKRIDDILGNVPKDSQDE
jgi:voltage-dependent potassium channel beta subunit